MSSTRDVPDLDALFGTYLDVVNRAIAASRHMFPYDRILDLTRRALGARDVGVAVYDRDPKLPLTWYAVRLQGDGFHRSDPCSMSPNDGATWRVPLAHLRAVARDPDRFVRDPAKLDLDWLQRRLGLS